MEITLEQVERLREKADVSYGQAKQALEYSGGNLLDALIYLEEQGAIPRPQGAYYSTRNETPPPPPSQEELAPLGEKTDGTEKGKKKKFKGMGVKVVNGKTLFGTLRRWLIDWCSLLPGSRCPCCFWACFSASGIRSPVRTWRTRPSTA